MLFTVRQLARISGVSVRALHHYDAIGLLHPRTRSAAGYRLYGEAELLRLQQVLLYRTQGMPLSEIQTILNADDLDTLTSLSRHRQTLFERQQELGVMLATVDKTIAKLRGEIEMSNQELYEGFPPEAKQYREEAIATYGEPVMAKSESALKRLSAHQREQLQRDFKELWETLSQHTEQDVSDSKVQTLIAKHYHLTRQFWGTAHEQDNQSQVYEGLGNLFAEDERFTALNGQLRPKFAQFMRDAIQVFCRTQLR